MVGLHQTQNETLYNVSQPTEVQPFYIKTRAQCLAPLQMYLTWLGTAIIRHIYNVDYNYSRPI
jgi:hypothetical protein